ncbi:MAG: LysE family translocator, partial [Rhodobacterales bacterium]|nr:LysE family translocator [Rhodobacterales bacterium]
MDAVFGADFLLTALVVVLVPGTGVVYTLAHGLGGGARASVVAATGCTLGILPHLGAALVGLAALLHASALAFQAVKVAGVIYLLYLAWMTLREKGALAVTPAESPRDIHAGRIALGGFLVNILNPKLSIFFLAFLPQFLSPDQAQATATMAAMGGVFMAMTLVVFIG